MARRFAFAILTVLSAALSGAVAGCGSHGQQPTAGAAQDAVFVQCANSPAVDSAPGIMVASASGAYVPTLVSSKTAFAAGPSADTAATGTDAWMVSVDNAADAGGGPADVMMTAQRPWMPL